MSDTRVVVFGYDELLLAHLEVLAETNAEVVGVVFPINRTTPQAEKVRAVVRRQGFTTYEQPSRKPLAPFLDELRPLSADLFLVWSYPLILPREMLDMPKQDCLNLHFGVLPQYRGGAAFRWAIANGERETGVTLHEMVEEVDAGPILDIEKVPIEEEDDIIAVMRKLRNAGQTLLRRVWPNLAFGKVPRTPQDESRAGYYPLWNEQDGRIDWTKTNRDVYNLVRSLAAPFPGAYTTLRGHRLVVRKVLCIEADVKGQPPGTICGRDPKGPIVATGQGGILLLHVSAPTDTPPKGMQISLGDRFGT